MRVEVRKVGGSNIVEKKGGEDIIVGHSIKCTVKKNKMAAPFRKAEFTVYYDGRKQDSVDELAAVVLAKGLLPKYDSKGNLSPTGRTYKWANEPEFCAKSKGEVPNELRKFPKMQEELTEILKGSLEDLEALQNNNIDPDSDLTDEEFEEKMKQEIEELEKGNSSDDGAEETSWGEL